MWKNDTWVKQHSRIEPEKLHALGVVTLNWNTAEFSLFWLFCTVSGLGGEQAWASTHSMQTGAIQQRVRDLLPGKITISEPIRRHVEFGLDALDICRLNRNQFTHFLPSQGKSGFAFHRNRGSSLDLPEIPSDVATIRKVAEEISKTSFFLTEIANTLSARHYSLLEALDDPEWPGLPDVFPLPERIWTPTR